MNTHVFNPDEPYVLKLLKPVKLGEVSCETLTLREPIAEEIEKATSYANPTKSNIVLISLISGEPEVFIKRLGQRDYTRACQYLENFTSGGPKDGEKPSPT